MPQTPLDRSMPVAVLGAGLGGLAAAIKLKEAGFEDVLILEKADRVGGTWAQNTYPGCACDVPVALYQYSFAQSLDWTNTYPSAPEMQRYCAFLVDSFGLAPHLELETEAVSAVWDERERRWTITARDGRAWRVGAIVAGLGQLNRPFTPDVEGRESFAGAQMHSAAWDHDVDPTGLRVGVVGSAASAVQLVPEVAKVAGELVVFQRSANWIAPRGDRAITDEEKALLISDPASAIDLAARNRAMIFDTADLFFWKAFSWSREGRAAYARIARDHLEAQVPDPALRAKLTPTFPVGCKRYLFADTYYPTFSLPHVRLETGRIDRIVAGGIVLADGSRRDLDVIVWATGFETTGWRWSVDVVGAGGARLADVWADGPEAHLGIMTAGFPNLFILYGPHTNLGHNSITFMLERQVEYVVKALSGLAAMGAASMAVKPEAQARFMARLSADLAGTVWADPSCSSWYKNDKGVVTQNWGGTCAAYAEAVREVVWSDHETA